MLRTASWQPLRPIGERTIQTSFVAADPRVLRRHRRPLSGMSAIHPKADLSALPAHVGEGPQTEVDLATYAIREVAFTDL